MANFQAIKASGTAAFLRVPSLPVDPESGQAVATKATAAIEESILEWESKYGTWPGGTDDWIEEARAAGLTADEAMNWPISLVKTHVQGHRRWLQASRGEPGPAAGQATGPATGWKASDPAEAPPQTKTRQRRKPNELNGAMLTAMMQRPETRGWSARRWGRELHACPSQITSQPAWKELEQFRSLQKINRQKSKRQGRAAK